MARELTRTQRIERSIIKKYRSSLWAPFMTAITRYELLSAGDRIAVCISGGKDSMLMAKLFQELSRHSEVPFETVFLVMDPGYLPENRRLIRENAELLNIPLTIFESNIFAVANRDIESPCYLCARMRRGALYQKAQELGCSKIALGHHLNDVIETTVMSMFHSAKLEAMIPKAHSENFPGMELIRPLYCIREEDIQAWRDYNGLRFLACACRFTEGTAQGRVSSRREETKALLAELQKRYPDIESNIFHALHSVRIETFPGYKTEGVIHSFLEDYEES